MTAVALALSVIAVLGVVVLTFGYAALLRAIGDLQDAVGTDTFALARRQFERFAGGRPSLVVVTDPGCESCRERLAELSVRASEDALPLALFVVSIGGSHQLQLPDNISRIDDPALLGELGVGVFPTGIVYDRRGFEIARSVLGDAGSLDRLIDWATDWAIANPSPRAKETA